MSFPAYEEFCSNYDLFTQDLAILRQSVPNWAMFDQGIEALSKSVASIESRKHEDNKSMTMSDLMIKVSFLFSHWMLRYINNYLAYPATVQVSASPSRPAPEYPCQRLSILS